MSNIRPLEIPEKHAKCIEAVNGVRWTVMSGHYKYDNTQVVFDRFDIEATRALG